MLHNFRSLSTRGRATAIVVTLVLIGVGVFMLFNQNSATTIEDQSVNTVNDTSLVNTGINTSPVNRSSELEKPVYNPVEFSTYGDDIFRFSANVSQEWKVAYVPATEAINIYDPNSPESSPLEQSLIFIRYFEASDFLTLSTVDILSRKSTEVSGHAAVEYEIQKKAGVPNFVDQPAWRSGRHSLIDIRLAPSGKTYFYVFAYNPNFPKEQFDAFISSLKFHNDAVTYLPPVDSATERITKKPFGILINPATSPVQPEKFSGYHTGTDFEMLNDQEYGRDIPVFAVCGGRMLRDQTAGGYGGYAVQECTNGGDVFTVVYGHLDAARTTTATYVAPGEQLGYLGDHESSETDGERKHLHLGFHKGSTVNIRGYVSSESALSEWMNPCDYVC